jgi:hypothetical protein
MTPKQSKDLLYNSRIIDTYIKMLKKQRPEIDAGIALEYANMQGYQVADQSHWFTQKQIDLFYEKLVVTRPRRRRLAPCVNTFWGWWGRPMPLA